MGTAPLQVITHHLREGVEKELQRLFVLLFFLLLQLVHHFFDMIGDIVGVLGSLQDEIVPIPGGVEYDIPFVENGVPE